MCRRDDYPPFLPFDNDPVYALQKAIRKTEFDLDIPHINSREAKQVLERLEPPWCLMKCEHSWVSILLAEKNGWKYFKAECSKCGKLQPPFDPYKGMVIEEDIEVESKCPACGEYISYCQGHGEIGDPYGHQILEQHDNDDHSMCHEDVCGDRQAEEKFEKRFER